MMDEHRDTSRRVRVMHLVPELQTGGMERGVVTLANHSTRYDVDSSICSFAEPDSLAQSLAAHVTVHVLGRRRGNDPRLVLKLMQLFRSVSPDVVHSHSWGTLCEGFLACRLTGVPVFVHGEHGTLEERRQNRLAQRVVWGRADRILAVSTALADRMAETVAFPRQRITVIRNGTDLQRFTSDGRTRARNDLGIPQDAFVLGTIGRLVPVKNQHLLLRVAGELSQRSSSLVTVIVGDGPLHGSLTEAVRASALDNRVLFLGHRLDVERILPAFDVFALTSRSEGMPNTILEAMACGLPVVSTDVGGVGELVENGVTGTLVPLDDEGTFVTAVESLWRRPAQRLAMGNAGRARAAAEFGLDRMLVNYTNLYRELATQRRPTKLDACAG